MWERPDVEAAVVDLQLVGLVALHHHMLVLLMPLKLTSLHSTFPALLKQAAVACMGAAAGVSAASMYITNVHSYNCKVIWLAAKFALLKELQNFWVVQGNHKAIGATFLCDAFRALQVPNLQCTWSHAETLLVSTLGLIASKQQSDWDLQP